MANIILISGAVSGEKRYGKLHKVGAYLPPYGLLCIAAVLEKGGHSVKLIDREVSPLSDQEIVDQIKKLGPDLVGMSCFTIGWDESVRLAQEIKRACEVPIVAGGPHVFFGTQYVKQCPYFDFLVVGEGERTVEELLAALEKGDEPVHVPGLLIRHDETWIDTGPREPVRNLDELPFPAFHLLDDVTLYHPSPFGYRSIPHFTLVTSRGCPFDCVFCSRLWGRKWRALSAPYVLELMRYLQERFGAREIWFAEDSFAIDRKRVIDICEGILAMDTKLSWTCMTSIHVLDEELLQLMKRAGCWQLQLGLESGNDEVLKFIRKPISTGLIREKVDMMHRMGLKVRGYFILGHLTDTRETIQQTIDFACSLPLYTAEFHILHLPLGSHAREIAHEYGQVNYDLSLLTGYGQSGLSFVPRGLTEEDMFAYRRKAHNQFFLRPQVIMRHLSDIRRIEDIKRYGLIAQAFASSLR